MKKLQNKIPPPVITLTFGLLMWAAHELFPILQFEFQALFYFGIGLIVIGLTFDIISFIGFRKNKTTVNPISPEKATSLVIDGFYRFTRNPMYLGMLLVLAGTGLIFATLSPFVLLPFFVLTMNFLQIKPEEKALEKIFSEQYIEYKKRVRRWL